MKKTSILTAVLAAITAAASTAMADEIRIDFDRPGAHGVTEELARITAKGAAIPDPVMLAVGTDNGTAHFQDELFLAKDLFAGIPSETRVAAISLALQRAPGSRGAGVSPAGALASLLDGVPAEVKKDFADNLKFMNGSVVSAKTDLLEKAVSREKYEKILDIIMPAPATKGGPGAATRAKDEACVAYTGAKSRSVFRGCDWAEGYTCNPSTCVSSKGVN